FVWKRRHGFSESSAEAFEIGQGVVGCLVVPRDGEDPPAAAVEEELDSVDAAQKGRTVRRATSFISGKHLRLVAEDEDAARRLDLVEVVLLEKRRAGLDVTVEIEDLPSISARGRISGWHQPRLGKKELSFPLPVPRTRRSRDDLVQRAKKPVDR